MSIREYIESGILELYVFGLLSEDENRDVRAMEDAHGEIRDEVLAIERAVIDLSYSVSPYLSTENYERIRQKLIERQPEVVEMRPKRAASPWLGWAAALLLMFGLAYQYYKYNNAEERVQTVSTERDKFKQLLANLQVKHEANEKALAVIRSEASTIVKLEGQAAAPDAFAKVYMNPGKQEIYVDIAGLPKPPEGKVYQVWALKLDPLTPTSIGILSDLNETNGMVKVGHFDSPDAFGITLEPVGGSATPTLEQLYTLGKV